MKNEAAQALGRLGKGRSKKISNAERKRRAKRLAKARQLRWPNCASRAGRAHD